MSETPPEPSSPPKKSGGNFLTRKAGPLPVWGWGALAFAGALGYFYWRSRTSSTSTTTAATSTGNYEATGTLSYLQAEIDQLMSEQGTSSLTGGGGSGGGGSTGGGSTSSPTSGGGGGGKTSSPTSGGGGGSKTSSPTSGGGTKTTTKPPTTGSPAPKKIAAPPAPGNVHATHVTSSSVALAWNKAAGATGYRIRVTYQSKLVHQATATATHVTVSGLTADHTYGFHVASTGPGGTSPEGDVNVKTTR